MFFDKLALMNLAEEIEYLKHNVHVESEVPAELEWPRDQGLIYEPAPAAPPQLLQDRDALLAYLHTLTHLGQLVDLQQKLDQLPWETGEYGKWLRPSLKSEQIFEGIRLQQWATQFYVARYVAAELRVIQRA